MKCMREGCDARARYAPKICVPAQGVPVAAERHLGVVFSVVCCPSHFRDIKPSDFLSDATSEPDGTHKLRDIFTILARSSQLEPDFERAFIRRVDIDTDPEWKVLQSRGSR